MLRKSAVSIIVSIEKIKNVGERMKRRYSYIDVNYDSNYEVANKLNNKLKC